MSSLLLPSNIIDAGSPINWGHPLAKNLVHCGFVMPGLDSGAYVSDIANMPFQKGVITNYARAGNTGFCFGNGPGGFGSFGHDGATSHVYVNFNGFDNIFSSSYQFKAMTFSVWVCLISNLVNFDTIFGPGDVAGTNYAAFLLDTSGVSSFYCNISGGSNHVNSTTVLPLNTWTHLCVVIYYDGSLSTLYHYTNGVFEASQPFSGVHSWGSNQLIYWGQTQNGSLNRPLNGFINDSRIYTKTFSASEVWNLYQNAKQGYPDFFNYIPTGISLTTGTSVARKNPWAIRLEGQAGYATVGSGGAIYIG